MSKKIFFVTCSTYQSGSQQVFSILDPKDVFYLIAGLALFGLTLRPALSVYRWVNLPLYYVIIGVGLAVIGLPILDPRELGLPSLIVEHGSELIVIISLAGAGLAIDTPATWRNWQAAFRLLIVAMPLTIAIIAILGNFWLSLPLASAVLLAAALAPTDPVLARSVQVGPPGDEERPMQLALTAEAGLNDGLAFPFVYLAITLTELVGTDLERTIPWWAEWALFDLLYRVIAGWLIGYGTGIVLSRVIFSRFGDGRTGGWNTLVVILSATFIAYGAAEALEAYGFLAVFAAARGGRNNTRNTPNEGYEKYVHLGAEQLETILLALLLLWLGMFAASGILSDLRWQEVVVAILIVFAIRPLSGLLSLLSYKCSDLERQKVAFFGVRGMGSIFYIAYAANHVEFADIDVIWRIATFTILLSILVHGFAANFALSQKKSDKKLFTPKEFGKK